MKQEKKKAKIYINPPPHDACCECCGKHISELKPFGKAGDPLVGDFDGFHLVKTFRTMCPRIEEEEKKVNAIKDWDRFHQKNPKEAERLSFYSQVSNTVGANWECRDCIILDTEEYFKKLEERNNEN